MCTGKKNNKKKKTPGYYLLSANEERAAICLDSGRAASWGAFEVITPRAPTGNTRIINQLRNTSKKLLCSVKI